ncbi:MAG: serine hydrolase domain-containing protein [Lactovum sp.]
MKSECFLKRIEDYLLEGIFPGCEFAILKNAVWKDFCFGNASVLPKKVDLKPGKLWDMASVSKVLSVGTLLTHQVFEREIDLDQSLRYYYPIWHEKTVTVRQLLTHTSAIDPYIENRERMSFTELAQAMNHLAVKEQKEFNYSDVNFILLGFLLEYQSKKSLSELSQELFQSMGMSETGYGPVKNAVPMVYNQEIGQVHDPKARVLGKHCGSAGLFSSLTDLKKFVSVYLSNKKYLELNQNFSKVKGNSRSLAWAHLNKDWLIHTGYTGTFLMINLKEKEAVIFLSNRIHLKDERQKWIQDRNLLIQDFLKSFK